MEYEELGCERAEGGVLTCVRSERLEIVKRAGAEMARGSDGENLVECRRPLR